jgi:CHAT domain-containing protein
VVTAHRVATPATTIDERARRLATVMREGDDDAAKDIAAALSADIFDPLLGELRNVSTLIIGGSPATIPIPFAALWSRRTGRYLLEDWTISYTRGVSRLTAAVRRDAQLRTSGTSEYDLFAVAPEYGASPSALPSLPSAASEADVLCRSYPRSICVKGARATVESFGGLARTASIIHFAGHSIANPDRPRYSALVFASDRLYAYQIASAELPSTRLVVLASCTSATSGPQPFAAPNSLADAFLDAQVPGVVATMTPIDDEASTSLLLDFHQQLQGGRAAPDALRVAQIAALRSGDTRRSHLQQWAPYCFIGWHSAKAE